MAAQCPQGHLFANSVQMSPPALVHVGPTAQQNGYASALACSICGHVFGVVRTTSDNKLA